MFIKAKPEKNVIILPPPNPKYTIRDWEHNNKTKARISEDQQKLANRVISESERVIDETRSVTDQWKKEADFRLKERIIDVQFQRDEIVKQKKDACLEEEALNTYRQRVINAIDNLREEATILCKKCIILRENRVGVDLVHDEVDVELKKELEVIKGSQLLLNKVLEETNEQIRRLQKMMDLLDKDLSNKEKTLSIDEQNLILKEKQLDMHVYEGHAPLDPFNSTINQWIQVTNRNIANTAKELNSAKPLRSYIDILLRQVVEDLETQVAKTNEAFKKRIGETRYAKIRLENLHRESSNQVNEVTRNITKLEKELADKEGYLALAQTRLANRTQRPGVEMCRDAVQNTLVRELNALNETCLKLSRMLEECKTALRYLLMTQMQQEEELNTKTNTLKVDEVDCMTVRQSLVFHKF